MDLRANTTFSSILQAGGHEVEEGDLPPGAEEHEEGEGGYPRSDSTYSIDIPNSVTLWEVDPRPNNSSQVLELPHDCYYYCRCM